MIAYKGFTEDLTATCGKGIFRYELYRHYTEEKSKTRSTGFHSAEYILDCMNWYQLNGKNRFFRVEASGSIDEEQRCSMVVSTEITLLKELSLAEITMAAVRYIIEHPKREWEKEGYRLKAKKDSAEETEKGSIVIARGAYPMAKAEDGGVIGLILETEDGIQGAYVRMVSKKGTVRPNTWYTINNAGKLMEVVR